MIGLSKEIKAVVDDKAKYTDWATGEDIKAELQVDLIILLDKYGYPPEWGEEVFEKVMEQAENFKRFSGVQQETKLIVQYINSNQRIIYLWSHKRKRSAVMK